jgi:hypothetical protein
VALFYHRRKRVALIAGPEKLNSPDISDAICSKTNLVDRSGWGDILYERFKLNRDDMENLVSDVKKRLGGIAYDNLSIRIGKSSVIAVYRELDMQGTATWSRLIYPIVENSSGRHTIIYTPMKKSEYRGR